MKPLTIEELKALQVGDWVWLVRTMNDVVVKEYRRVYEEIDENSGSIMLQGVEFIGTYPFNSYGKTWLAHRNKQEGEGEPAKKMITFRLNGCDISFAAVAPSDMTVEQLVKQGNRIEPDWCACGICAEDGDCPPEIIFDYDDVKVANDDVNCTIRDKE